MNEKAIWDFLVEKTGNQFGAAALMGNLYIESTLKSEFLQGSYSRKLGMSSQAYTIAVDSGDYDQAKFSHDSAGYGIAQWTYWSRKEKLYMYAKEQNKSIGDMAMQLNFMWSEIQSYKAVVLALKTGKSIREISDVICKKYLKPANQGEYYLNNRATRGQAFYTKYAKPDTHTEDAQVGEQPKKEKMIVATSNVNIRVGNAMSYAKVGVLRAGESVKWIATSEDGWHAFKFNDKVCWVSGEFAEVR